MATAPLDPKPVVSNLVHDATGPLRHSLLSCAKFTIVSFSAIPQESAHFFRVQICHQEEELCFL